jgi:hypothetical protein
MSSRPHVAATREKAATKGPGMGTAGGGTGQTSTMKTSVWLRFHVGFVTMLPAPEKYTAGGTRYAISKEGHSMGKYVWAAQPAGATSKQHTATAHGARSRPRHGARCCVAWRLVRQARQTLCTFVFSGDMIDPRHTHTAVTAPPGFLDRFPQVSWYRPSPVPSSQTRA